MGFFKNPSCQNDWKRNHERLITLENEADASQTQFSNVDTQENI